LGAQVSKSSAKGHFRRAAEGELEMRRCPGAASLLPHAGSETSSQGVDVVAAATGEINFSEGGHKNQFWCYGHHKNQF
jgi:hypothetical protein